MGPSRGFIEPILDNPGRKVRRTTRQIYAGNGEHTAEDAAPWVTKVIEITSVGSKTGNNLDQIVENKDEDKSKVVLLWLDSNVITTMMIDRAVHELGDQVTALVFQFFEERPWEYIYQMVQESLGEDRSVALNSSYTIQVMMPTNQETLQIFSVTKVAQSSLLMNRPGEKLSDPFRKRADLRVYERIGLYIPSRMN